MKSKTSLCVAAKLIACSALTLPAIAAGQTVPGSSDVKSESQASEAGVAQDGLTEIVVNAQRRVENAQKVPIAITAVGPAQIAQLNLRSIDSIQTVTPNLTFNTGYGFAQLFIRGIGSNFTTAGLENAVGTYVDGAYVERGFGVVFDLLDVGSVQALKGPQGTLWGRNATGGAILINTADPTDKFEVNATGEYGRYNHVMTDLVVNVPLSDTLSARVAGRYRRDDGYVHNVVTNSTIGESRSWSLRGKLKWAPSTSTSAVLTIERDDAKGGMLPERQALNAPLCLACSFVPGARSDSTLGYFETDLDFTAVPVNKATNVNLRVKHSSDWINLESVTAYRDQADIAPSDQDYSRGDFFAFASVLGGKTFSQDFTVSTQSKRWWDVLFGVSYLHDDGYYGLSADGAQFRTVVPGQLPSVRNEVTTESISAFGELTLTPAPRLKLVAGGRYTYDRKEQRSSENLSGNLVFAGGSGVLNFGSRASFRSFTPRFVASYDAGLINLYASYSEGFKAGGFNSPAFAPAEAILPERIKNYEIGAKFVSADRKLRVNLAAFKYKYSDIQVTIVDIRSGGGVIKNAAGATGKGVELDFQYQPFRWLEIFGGGSYLKARYDAFSNASVAGPVDAAGNPVPVGSPLTAGLGNVTENLAGFPLNRAPDWQAFGGVNVNVPVGDNLRADFSGVARYTAAFDHVPGAGGPLRLDHEPSYTLVNLSGSIGPDNDRYRIGFYVDNLLNTRYATSRQTSAPFGAYFAPARPITYGLRVKASY